MNLSRYHRQILLPQIGEAGQRRLASSRVLLVGCGALGSGIAEQLARAGVGFIRIVDRDIVELTNLQRQVLFDESDVTNALPKSVAAANRLARVNSSIRLDPIVADADATNIESFCDVDLILDGTDNAATRYLTNDVSIKHSIPWIYGACVGTEGRVMTIRPGIGPCLRCVFPEPPAAGELPTCDTAGVLGPVAGVVASMQVVAAIKLLLGTLDEDQLISMDLWSNRIRVTGLSEAKRSDCSTCALRRFEFLADTSSRTVQLCGRQSVQIRSSGRFTPAELSQRLNPFGTIQQTPYFVRCDLRDERPLSLTVFLDGRTIVHGTNDPARAKAIHARYVGA
jgi:adenylyltransferase/sulfurtransferase